MDINGAEIFATGQWNSLEFAESDLDAMAQSFNELALAGKVPLKMGHNEKQPFTDGQPALGWVSRVWRDGGKLLADFTAMPRVVYDAVKAGLYKYVSVELLRDASQNGVDFPWVLSAVALLGADIPAVSGLKDLQTLAMSRKAALRSGVALTFTRGVSTNGGRKTMMDETNDKLMAQVQQLSEKVASFTTTNATLKADNDRLAAEAAAREDAIRKEKIAGHRTAIKAKFDAAIVAKTMIPSVRSLFEKNPAFTSDEGVLGIALDFVDNYINEHKVEGKGQPRAGSTSVEDETDENKPFHEQVRDGTLALMAKTGEKVYFTANQTFLKLHPELAEKYRSEPGIKGGKAA